METTTRVVLIALALAGAGLAFLWLQPRVVERLAPVPELAWVAIDDGDGLAKVGPVAIPAGKAFTLHAVLEAKDRGGKTLYYTQARGLSLFGEEVPAEALRPWDRRQRVQVRWFTVEGRRPSISVEGESEEILPLEELFRSDWPSAWSIPGDIDAAHDNHLQSSEVAPRQLFGTQRYHVRIELYEGEGGMVPSRRFRSWGAADLEAEVERFPTVVMALPGRLAAASKVFGLSQLTAPEGASGSLLARINDLSRLGLAFSRPTVLRDQVAAAGRRFDELEWISADLGGGSRWGEPAAGGDLLRVADRVVVLYEDRGQPGVLDYEDLCFDFVRGATVRSLSEVFAGGGEIVELASLG